MESFLNKSKFIFVCVFIIETAARGSACVCESETGSLLL